MLRSASGTPASGPGVWRNVITLAGTGLTLVAFGLVPLQWLPVFAGLRLSDIGFLLLAFVLVVRFALSPRQRLSVTDSPELGAATALFVAYLFFYGLSLAYSDDPGSGLFVVVREVVYIAFALLIAVTLRGMKPERLAGLLTKGLLVALFSFCIVGYVMLRAQGVHFFQSYVVAIASGGPNAVQHTIYYRLFNSSLPGASSAARHGINYLFVIGAISSSAKSMIQRERGLERRIAPLITLAFAVVVAASLSRQALLPLVIFFSVMAFRWPRWARMGALVLVLVAAWGIAGSVVSSTLEEKFVADVVHNPRLEEYGEAIRDIDRLPLIGEGAGTTVEGTAFAHNLFLHAWQQAGLLAAAAALGCILFLVAALFRSFVLALGNRYGVAGYRAAMTVGLVVLVLVRVMVGVRGSLEPATAGAWGLALALAPPSWRRSRKPSPRSSNTEDSDRASE